MQEKDPEAGSTWARTGPSGPWGLVQGREG